MTSPSLPITGRPADILPYLTLIVGKAVSARTVSWFKIGRSNDPAAREIAYKSEYSKKAPFRGPDHFVTIYQTSSVNNVKAVEKALIGAFQHKFKGLNISDHAGGNTAPDHVQYVYIALWEKR